MTARSITCPHCGLESFNASDVEMRYCGNCKAFHDDINLGHLGFLMWLQGNGYEEPKPLKDKPGRWAALQQFMFTWAIIEGQFGDYHGYEDRWCYSTREKAKAAFEAWNGIGEPTGWHRHPDSGRRVNLETGEEYVEP